MDLDRTATIVPLVVFAIGDKILQNVAKRVSDLLLSNSIVYDLWP